MGVEADPRNAPRRRARAVSGARVGSGGRALLAGGIALLAAAVAAPALAQDGGEIQALTRKIERLQGELNDLQRAVYNSDADISVPKPEPSASASGGASGGGLSTAAAARLQQRITSLEQDLRRVTGDVEETSHQVRQLRGRLEKLMTDVDYRFQQIKKTQDQILARLEDGAAGGGAQTAAASDGGESGSASADPPASRQQASGDQQAEGGASGDGTQQVPGRESQTLGQVSQEAVDAVRERAEASQSGQANGAGGQDGGAETAADGGADSAEETRTAATSGDVLPDGDPTEQYQYAYRLLQQADYGEAEAALRAFLRKHPSHKRAGNAKYWLGETFYVRENYEQAAVVFAEGFRNYPNSPKAPANLLKLGMTLAKIDKTEQACQLFAELQNRFQDAEQNILQRAKREQSRLECST